MQIYPAIISKDTSNRPANYSLDDYVKVRIPNFHGPKTSYAYEQVDKSIISNIATEEELPWALVNRGFDNKEFSALSFQDGDIVNVGLENEDINYPIILGFGSRFSYTEDPEVAKNNLLY